VGSRGRRGVVLMASPATTPNANEFILFRAKGNCYKFVRVAKEWSKTGEGCAVRPRFLFFACHSSARQVMLLHDRARNLHRIVG
jgi:hypothetical protein